MSTTAEISAIVRETFNFEVKRFGLKGPDGLATPHCGLFRVYDENGDGGVIKDCVGMACSDGYTPHTSDDVITLVEAAGEAFDGEFDFQCYWRDGHHVFMQPTKKHRFEIFGTADNIFPTFAISAGYDGRAFRASLAMKRDLCKNMARLQTVSSTSAAIRHTQSLNSKIGELVEIFKNLKSSWGKTCDIVAQMEQKRIVLADFLGKVYPVEDIDSKRGKTIHKERTEAIFTRILQERQLSGRSPFSQNQEIVVSGWEAFNGVQGFIQHGTNRRTEQNNEFSRILLAMEDKTVKLAETLILAS